MGWWSTKIMGGDTPWDFEDIIYSICGLEKWPEKQTAGNPEAKIPKEVFDSKMEKIVKAVEDYKYDLVIGYQVLGYLAMKFGATLSETLRVKITEACDEDEWAKENDERAKYINQLKDQIKTYNNTQVSDLDKDHGVFAKITEKNIKEK